MLERMQARSGEIHERVRDQHTNSQVLSRRFAAPAGPDQAELICRLNVHHPAAAPRLVGPDGVGRTDHFLPVAARSAETYWKTEVEDQLHDALRATEAGTLFENLGHVQTIKDAVALHFARSRQLTAVHRRIWPQFRAGARAQWRDHPAVEQAFYRRYGLYPAGPQARDLIFDEMTAATTKLIEGGAYLRERVEELFLRTRAALRQRRLLIAVVEAGELLIGDVPALTVRLGHEAAGVLAGIGLMTADTTVLPLGPRHLAAIGPTDTYCRLSTDETNYFNRLQINAATDHVYFRPGSGLETIVRAARTAATTPLAS
jgi:hypothetical protein